VFIGGAGIDTVSYYFAVTGLVARLDHPELNTGEASGDTYSGVENLYGSQFGDTLCGDSGSNVLTGWAGNDSLWGYGGGDTLDGGDGNDYLVGGAGADVFIGGAGIDTVSYYFAVTGLVARLDHPELNTGEASGDTYSGVENLYGSQFGDTLCGDSGSNVLTGWAGNDSLWGYGGGDTLDGGDGNDYLVGGPGPDTFIGGAGNDTVSYYFAGTGLTARLDHPELNTGEAAGDTYSGVENLYGSQFDDVLAGDANANVLTGWGGNDTFLFATAPSAANIDTIADFTVGADKIALDHTVFAALSVGALPSGEFFIGNAPQDSSDHIIYNAQTGALYYDPDGTGAVQTMQFATVSAGLNLHADCFLVV
jgi:serralysin